MKLSEIYIYPVKSLSGIKVNTWPVTSNGLLYDRHWMIIDKKNRFLSQRQLPRMALIKTALSKDQLILTAANKKSIAISLIAANELPIQTTIWHDQCEAKPVSSEADQWLSDFLQQPCRLVCKTEQKRLVDQKYATPDDQVAFSDGFPFLIISENSLVELNQAMGLTLPMIRFRPNLVISGGEAFIEDTWRNITINSINFRLPKPCSRCSIPTIDTKTSLTDKEPLKTLSQLRKWQSNVYFGQNALHDQAGELNVGDTVTIQQIGEKQPPI